MKSLEGMKHIGSTLMSIVTMLSNDGHYMEQLFDERPYIRSTAFSTLLDIIYDISQYSGKISGEYDKTIVNIAICLFHQLSNLHGKILHIYLNYQIEIDNACKTLYNGIKQILTIAKIPEYDEYENKLNRLKIQIQESEELFAQAEYITNNASTIIANATESGNRLAEWYNHLSVFERIRLLFSKVTLKTHDGYTYYGKAER